MWYRFHIRSFYCHHASITDLNIREQNCMMVKKITSEYSRVQKLLRRQIWSKGTELYYAFIRLKPWRWRQYIPPKLWYVSKSPHGIITALPSVSTSICVRCFYEKEYREHNNTLKCLDKIFVHVHAVLKVFPCIGTALFFCNWFRSQENKVENRCEYLVLTYYRVGQLLIKILINLCGLQNRC
jgi:hypothetical protein